MVGVGYTMREVVEHSDGESAWLVIDNKVYDVTDYLASGAHPGGNEVLLKYAGSDATKSFTDVHSNDAWNILDDYLIGTYVDPPTSYYDRVKQLFFRMFY